MASQFSAIHQWQMHLTTIFSLFIFKPNGLGLGMGAPRAVPEYPSYDYSSGGGSTNFVSSDAVDVEAGSSASDSNGGGDMDGYVKLPDNLQQRKYTGGGANGGGGYGDYFDYGGGGQGTYAQ